MTGPDFYQSAADALSNQFSRPLSGWVSEALFMLPAYAALLTFKFRERECDIFWHALLSVTIALSVFALQMMHFIISPADWERIFKIDSPTVIWTMGVGLSFGMGVLIGRTVALLMRGEGHQLFKDTLSVCGGWLLACFSLGFRPLALVISIVLVLLLNGALFLISVIRLERRYVE